jgi:hypothetical protein
MSYAVFLLLLTVPALEWLLPPQASKKIEDERTRETIGSQQPQAAIGDTGSSRSARLAILILLLAATILQGIRYQTIFRRDGPKRQFEFDVPYKAAYDAATAEPIQPIYLQDGKWGPGYMHAMWYATIEGRPKSEFVHLTGRGRAPRGSIVITSDENCENCEIIKRSGVYLLYRAN